MAPGDDARIIRIDDPEDARILEFRSIRERDLTGRQNRFIAEGTVVLRMLADAHAAGDARFVAEKILLLENRVAGLEAELARFPADVPVYVASAAVLDAIAGFHLHRGVLALGYRR
ncbi:MAG: RNA methyltransferase, partial [Pseudorhizobium sp.]